MCFLRSMHPVAEQALPGPWTMPNAAVINPLNIVFYTDEADCSENSISRWWKEQSLAVIIELNGSV